MKRILFSFLFVFLSVCVISQNILQDNKGQTSLNLNPGKEKSNKDSAGKETIPFALGQIKVSSKEKKVELNYYQYFRPDSVSPSFIGVSASGEVKNSLSSLFASGDAASGANIKLKYGKRLYYKRITRYGEWEREIKRKYGRDPTAEEKLEFVDGLATAKDLWFVLSAGFEGSKFKLFYPDSVFGSQVQKINFSTVDISGGFNFWTANLFKSVALIGVTIGYKNSNNFDDLDEAISEDVTLRTRTADSNTRKVTEKNTVYKGAYKETKSYPLNIDLYFKPHKFENVAFLIFCRNVMYKGELPQTKFGAGVYFLRKNNLFDPVFGINLDYADVFDNNKEDDGKPKINKLNVGIVTDLNTLLFQKRE